MRRHARIEGARRAWVAACAVLCLGSLATRALHFASPDLPRAVDDAVGWALSFHFLVFTNLLGLTLLVLGLLPFAALAAWRGRAEPAPAGGFRISGWLAGWLWLAVAALNPMLDLNARLAALPLLAAPLLLVAFWLRGSGVRLALAAGFGIAFLVWSVPEAPRSERVLGAAWLGIAALLCLLRPRFARGSDWLVSLLAGTAAVQGASLVNAVFPGDHGGSLAFEGGAYAWCEIPERGALYATHTGCGQDLAECRDDYVLELDRDDPRRQRRLHFFDESFHGRMLHLLCLADRVQVGMATTRLGDRRHGGNVLEFDAAHPERFSRDVLGKGDGAAVGVVFAHHPGRDTTFYVHEFTNEVVRVRHGEHPPERLRFELAEARSWSPPHTLGFLSLSFEGSLATSPDAYLAERNSVFLGEWIRGSQVLEVDVDSLEVIARYRTNNGGNNTMTVDRERMRLLVPGLWGLEVVDLRTGAVVARRRTDLMPRLPVIDAQHDLVFVTATLGGGVDVLDRDSFERLGHLPVGVAGRNPHVTSDGALLFASGTSHTWFWDTGALARRFRR